MRHWIPPEKIELIKTNQRLLNVYETDAVDISTVRRWIRRFQSGDRDVRKRAPNFYDRGWQKCIKNGCENVENTKSRPF